MIIDLTLPVSPGMPVYPGDPETAFSPTLTHERDRFSVHTITMSSHAGTHIDAPYHADPAGRRVDDPAVLEACVGPALVVRVSGREDADIMPDDLDGALDGLAPGGRLLIATGWSDRYGAADYYERHPRLSPALADVLAAKRPALVGIDMPSVHTTESERVHHTLLAAGIVVVENLASLDRLPERVFFAAAPLRLAGLDGSPVRAWALVEEYNSTPLSTKK